MNKTKNHGGVHTSLKTSTWRGASQTKTRNKQTSKAQTADNLFHCCCSEWESTNKSPQVGFSKGSVLVVAPSSFSSVTASLSRVSTNPKPSPKDCLSTTASLRCIKHFLPWLVWGLVPSISGEGRARLCSQLDVIGSIDQTTLLFVPWWCHVRSSVHSPEGGWQWESSSHNTALFRSSNSMQLWHSRGPPGLFSVLQLCHTPGAVSCRYECAGSQYWPQTWGGPCQRSRTRAQVSALAGSFQ